MRPVHTCFRTALTRAFRPSSEITLGAWAVPDFLVPAIVKPLHASRRSLSHSSAQQSQSESSPTGTEKTPREQNLYGSSGIPPRDRTESKIPLPNDELRQDMEAWLTALEPFLPTHLQRATSGHSDGRSLAPVVDYARLLNEAQASSQDILSHLGIVEGRWNAVLWLIKRLIEESSAMRKAPGTVNTANDTAWRKSSQSLEELTQFPIYAERIRQPRRLIGGLKVLTSAPETIQFESNIITSALGQVWRSLGYMILLASEEQASSTSTVMSHVLEIIGYLHHIEMIPKAIYQYTPAYDSYTLQQPPTLHLLSSRILTSLSDATWRAHEASVQEGKDRFNSQYFLGHEIPGSRYKISVPEVGPEIWVELVLWSCLHGGWILDGVAILEKLLSRRDDKRWSVICWRDIVASSNSAGSLRESKNWEKLAATFEYPNRSYASDRGDRRLVQRTISSEVVAAFVDGLTNNMRVGVGARGTTPEQVLLHIKNLKQLLDQDNLSLGTSSWDAIILRLLESNGIIPEKKPDIVLSILTLSQGFGKELLSANTALHSPQHDPCPNYVFEASAACIGLLHRTLRAFIDMGNALGAVKTLSTLQEYTDHNKMSSMTAFFQSLKHTSSSPQSPFASTSAPIDFPGFFPRIPVPVLADMLDLFATSRFMSLCTWLLFSRDIDGALIARRMYADRRIAPSIIRYGTISRDKTLLLNVVQAVAVPEQGKQEGFARLPAEILSAFLNSQIEGREWGSVKSICQYAQGIERFRPRVETLATFACEMLREANRMSATTGSELNKTAKAQFVKLLYAWQEKISTFLEPQLNTILGILSTVHPAHAAFCKDFWTASGRQDPAIRIAEFNKILEGVAEGYGAVEGKRIIDLWCRVPPGPEYLPHRSPGGLPRMARIRLSRGAQYDTRPEYIEVDPYLSFRALVKPNIHTYRILLRAAKRQYEDAQANGTELSSEERMEHKEMLTAVGYALRSMGLDLDDISREMGILKEDADLPAAVFKGPNLSGWDEELDDV